MFSSGGEIDRYAGDQVGPRCRWSDGSLPRHLQDEVSTSTHVMPPRVSVRHVIPKEIEPTGLPFDNNEDAFYENLERYFGSTTTNPQSDLTEEPSVSLTNVDYTEIAESLNSSHVSTLQTVKDGRFVRCVADCGVTYERLTFEDCNRTQLKILHPSLRSTLTTSKTTLLPVEIVFLVSMIFVALGTLLTGVFACIHGRRQRTPSKDAFVYFHETYNASEAAIQEEKDGSNHRLDELHSSSPKTSELIYPDLDLPSSSCSTSGCYPMLTRQSPSSPADTADNNDVGGGGVGVGGDRRLPWTQLNLLFSTDQYSLLEAGCRPPVSPGNAAYTATGVPTSPTNHKNWPNDELLDCGSVGPCSFRHACERSLSPIWVN
ncbi:unnamed protein product [Schistocephalus solidus]|uniref:C-CAP/cofactor C-like domain-containing protein n=1 Tax=Schistocephalus solidus TaxID=70667 RepID=A0A183STI6_SCHSO|nr:unnamed protein product [Schistocephalus solidus]